MAPALLCLLPSCSCPFTPCNQFSSQSPFQHLVFAPYRSAICLPWFHPTHSQPPPPNCVYAACVLFVSSTCHSETHCPASHTPNLSRTADCRRDAAAEDHTRLSKGLPAGPSPAAEANAAYFHCTLVRFLHIYFSTCVYYLIWNAVLNVRRGRPYWGGIIRTFVFEAQAYNIIRGHFLGLLHVILW